MRVCMESHGGLVEAARPSSLLDFNRQHKSMQGSGLADFSMPRNTQQQSLKPEWIHCPADPAVSRGLAWSVGLQIL